jgi:hypothetical protein
MHCHAKASTSISRAEKVPSLIPAMLLLVTLLLCCCLRVEDGSGIENWKFAEDVRLENSREGVIEQEA